jgi:predicted  nucleic acid-binding Zn-ribbon protein
MAALNERVDKHDREIATIRKLIHTGMKLLVRLEEEQVVARKEMRELRASQRETASQLQALIRSLSGGGGNGQVKRGVH